MRRVTLVLAIAITGCLPDLSPWDVVRPDGGRVLLDASARDAGPRPDGGGRDAQVLPPDDCASPRPIGALYEEDFEAGAAGWVVSGGMLSWELGAPRGEGIATAASGANAWVTVLGGEYPDREETYVVSPCFDASAADNDLLLTLSVAARTEQSADRGSVEVSLDGGVTWAPVEGESRLGWYAGQGWSGELDWTEAAAILPGTARQPRVQIRVKFRSDGSVRREGFAFDAVSLRPTRLDLAAEIRHDARCGWAIGRLVNVGGVPVTGYQLVGRVDGAPTATPYDDTIAYLESREVTFGGPLATSLSATAVETGDVDPSNDTASLTVTSVPFPSGGFFADFEANDGGLEVGGENPSWEWGAPAAPLFDRAASGARAWVTNLDGEHNAPEQSYLQSPCYDMSALTRDPQLSFMLVYQTETCCDRASIQMSIDGSDLTRVGSTSSGGTNWYTGSGGWSGSSGAGDWQLAQHPLTGAAGHRYVRFQFAFRADGSVENEGFGVDDVQVLP